MSVVDEFLRRFAASPLHVPQLERVLAAYGGVSPDAFAAAVIESDREAAHPEATRIALELLANGLDRAGVRFRTSTSHGFGRRFCRYRLVPRRCGRCCASIWLPPWETMFPPRIRSRDRDASRHVRPRRREQATPTGPEHDRYAP